MRWFFVVPLLVTGCAAAPDHSLIARLPTPEPRGPAPERVERVERVDAPASAAPASPASLTLAERIAALRGLTFQRPVEVHALDDAAFARRVDAATTGPEPRGESLVALAFALGPMRVGAAAARGPSDRYEGLYDFHAHELLVRRGGERKVEGVVAHELVHALQDQHFGLLGEDAEPDEALALRALYEGDAVLTRERFAARSAGEDEAAFVGGAALAVQTRSTAEVARAVGASGRVLAAPSFRRDEVLFPYLAGFRFAWALYREGGTAAVDEAFAHPPTSTMEILHPERFLRHERPRIVVDPSTPSGARVLGAGTLGELRTTLVVARCAKAATEGWEGDRFVVWQRDASTVELTWTTAWRDDEGAQRFARGLLQARRCLPGRGAAAVVQRDGRNVTLTTGR